MRVAVRFAAAHAITATNTVATVATTGIASFAAACPTIAFALTLLAIRITIAGLCVADVQPPVNPESGTLHKHRVQQITIAVQHKVFESRAQRR